MVRYYGLFLTHSRSGAMFSAYPTCSLAGNYKTLAPLTLLVFCSLLAIASSLSGAYIYRFSIHVTSLLLFSPPATLHTTPLVGLWLAALPRTLCNHSLSVIGHLPHPWRPHHYILLMLFGNLAYLTSLSVRYSFTLVYSLFNSLFSTFAGPASAWHSSLRF